MDTNQALMLTMASVDKIDMAELDERRTVNTRPSSPITTPVFICRVASEALLTL